MLLKTFAALAFLIGPVAHASALPEAVALKGNLVAAGFACKNSTASFVTCMSPVGRDLIGYTKPFAVIIPPKYLPGGRLVLHLHGWLENKSFDRTPQAILEYFDFPALLAQSGVLDTLFILPFSAGKCDTYKNELVDSFERVLGNVFTLLKEPAPRAITISGHSGAWTPIEDILEDAFKDDGQPRKFGPLIDSAFLFDATYSGDLPIVGGANPFMDSTEGFKLLSRSIALKPQPRISVVFRHLTYTELGARRLKRELVGQVRSIEQPKNADHWGTVKAGFPTFLRELKN